MAFCLSEHMENMELSLYIMQSPIVYLSYMFSNLTYRFFFLSRFQVMDWLSLSPGPRPNARAYRDQEQVKIIFTLCYFTV